MIKEGPIIFNGKMVRAILDGRKTQTRRPVQWLISTSDHGMSHSPIVLRKGLWWKPEEICPYGRPGDRLWVRETWQAQNLTGDWWHEVPREIRSLCNWAFTNPVEPAFDIMPPRWMPSIFMPHMANRITLEVMRVRVERVQEISDEDAIAEGINENFLNVWESGDDTPRGMFGAVWDSINTKLGYAWEINPWVWVVEFSPLRPAGASPSLGLDTAGARVSIRTIAYPSTSSGRRSTTDGKGKNEDGD